MQLTLVFATFGPAILKPDLHPRLAESESLAELLPHEGVRIVSLVEESLELGELLQSEVRSRSPLLAASGSAAVRPAAARSCGQNHYRITVSV